jgi:hypothetical protein
MLKRSKSGSGSSARCSGSRTAPRPRARCFTGRCGSGGRASTPRSRPRLTRQGSVRSGRPTFPSQCAKHRAGACAGGLSRLMPAPLHQVPRRLPADPFRGRSLSRRGQFHAGPTRLGKPDGDGLLGGAGAMLAFTDVVHFLAHEFTGLRGGRLAFLLSLMGAFQSLRFRHDVLSSATLKQRPLRPAAGIPSRVRRTREGGCGERRSGRSP